MHLSIAQMGSKSDEFSDETDHVAVASQYSMNEDKTGDSLYHSPSEASNLLNVNSSYDSYSENLESKATARPSSKVVESHVDSISCAGRASDANIAFSCCNKDLDRKNSSHSSATVCSLGSGKVPTSQKLDLSELPLIKEVDSGSSSPRIQIPHSHSGSSKSAVGGRSEISPNSHPKLEADIDDNSKDQLDKTGKSWKEDELDKSVKLPDKHESPLQTASLDEGYESDASELDVKVCDICGDAGREDLLVICSKCTDGAEHTYCMREMLRKVPEGDWLCEECKLAVETESQKRGSDAEGKKAKKLGSSTSILGNRHVENLEGASAPKRQAGETNMGSPKSLSPSRASSLSREGSFKNLDKGKVRPSPQISLGNHSGNDVPEAVRSPTSAPRLQTPRRSLLKCSSFNTLNSKPKVKLVDEVVPQKRKSAREHASLDKEKPARMMAKSMSFESGNSGRLNAGESEFKLLSSKYPHVQDLKGLKQVKERISLERKKISKLDHSSSTILTPKVDQKLTPRADVIFHSSAINHRETKVVQPDGKPNTLSRSTSSLARKGVKNSVSSAVPSTNGRISSEQKLNHVSLKEETSSSSSQALERQPNNINGFMSDGLSQSIDSTNQREKSRESAVSRSSKRVPCLKCKEMSHAAEYCSVYLASVADRSAPRTSKVETNKGNKLKAAIEAAMRLKPGICERISQDPSSFFNKAKNVISVEDTDERNANLCNQASTGNMKLLNSHATDAVSVVSSVGNLSMRDIHAPPLATVYPVSKMSAIPEHEYIWQGAFDVNKHGKPPEFCGGIQAHISTLASPKVLEVVSTFPHKVSLAEVPRLSTWPTQFHNCSPKEDNIALYFFAKDIESYEKNYKMLLDTMVKNDLALKGNFEGVELLIFPSSQLPEHCQRWNNLFFLWGVFKGRKSNCSNSSKSVHNPNASMVPLERQIYDSPQPVDDDSATCDSSCNVVPVNTAVEKTCISTDSVGDNKISSLTYGGIKAKLEEQDNKVDPKFLSRIATSSTELHPKLKCTSTLDGSKFLDCRSDPDLKPCLQVTETNTGSFKVEEEMHIAEDYPSLKDRPTGKQEAVVEEKVDGDCVKIRDIKDNGCADLKTSLNTDLDRWQYYPLLKDRPTGKQVAVVEEKVDGDSIKIRDSKVECADEKTYSNRDLECWPLNHQKRPYIDLTEPVSEVEEEMHIAEDYPSLKDRPTGKQEAVVEVKVDGDSVGIVEEKVEEEMHIAEDYLSLKDRPIGKHEAVVEEKVDEYCVKIRDIKDNGCADLKTPSNTDLDCWQYYPLLKDRPTGKQAAVVEEKVDGDSVKIRDSKVECADEKTSSNRDLECWPLNHQKRPYIDLTEPVSEVEEEMHRAEDYPSLKDRPTGKQEAVVEKADGYCVKIRDSRDNGYADLKTSNTDLDCWQYYPSLKDRLTGKQAAVVEEKVDEDSVKIRDSKVECADGKTSSNRDLECWQLNHRKRPYIDLTEPVSEVSTITSQKMPWSEATRVSVDRVNDNKKLKMGFSRIYQYSSARDQVPFSDSLASNRHNPGSGSSVEEERYDIACEENIIPEDLGNNERFFPVDPCCAGEFQLGDNSKPWKEPPIKDEYRVHDVSPSLELALGAKTRPPDTGILPFFVGAVDKNDNQNKQHDKVTRKKEEDVSAPLSLSLSLSFPFPGKEQDVKPVPKAEQQVPGRHPVNTSLLLFGGFPEK